MTQIFFLRYISLLIFGITLSFSFAGINFSKRNIILEFSVLLLSTVLQVLGFLLFGEDFVWKAYPFLAHLPIALLLFFFYKKRISTILASISSAYLCCQPAKWAELLYLAVFENKSFSDYSDYFYVICLVLWWMHFIKIVAPYVSKIFNKNDKSVFIFGVIPMIYYLYDYSMTIYTNLLYDNIRVVIEFLPLLFCFVYFTFCLVYYREYEQKTEAVYKEQIIRIVSEQGAKEMETIKIKEKEAKFLRHDMRHFFGNLQLCLAEGNIGEAIEMISAFSEKIESTAVMHFCKNSTVNYVISAFAEKFREKNIRFVYSIKLEDIDVDEISFSSIISNALENAYNAQLELPEEKRQVELMLCSMDEKILLSIKNPYLTEPVFSDGVPVSTKEGHGFGTQSIIYLTESLGGNCQFSVTDKNFIIRVVI